MRALWNRRDGPLTFDYLIPLLSSWTSPSRSSMLFVKGSLTTRRETTGLVTDLIDFITLAKVPIIWALQGKHNLELEHDAPIQILRYLVMQIIQLNTALLNKLSANFNAAVLQSATIENDWFDILSVVVSGLPELYIVIDAELLQFGGKSQPWPTEFLNRLENFIQESRDTILKIIIFSYRQLPNRNGFSKKQNIVVANVKKLPLVRNTPAPTHPGQTG
jgi:hypothetical protein